MTEPTDSETGKDKSKKIPLGTISAETVIKEASNIESEPKNSVSELENNLIQATRLLLKHYGVRRSGAAIRDAVDTANTAVGPKEAVSALSNFGFKASFGSIKLEKLTEDFFPLIGFKKMAWRF